MTSIEYALPPLEEDASRRRATMGARVFETIRRAIIQLQLEPGNIVSEAEIARQLGVSRQPVREAFIKLDEAGLVEIRPQRGTRVRLISLREVATARFIREAIEVAVVRKAALEAGTAEISALEATIAGQRAVTPGDNAAFLRLDEQFHQQLAASAGAEDAWRVLEGLKAQMDRVRYLSLPEATPLDVIIGPHAAILAAVAAGSPDEAEAAMRQHLSEILVSLPKLSDRHPSLFAP